MEISNQILAGLLLIISIPCILFLDWLFNPGPFIKALVTCLVVLAAICTAWIDCPSWTVVLATLSSFLRVLTIMELRPKVLLEKAKKINSL
jgi:hypothetical protein